MVQDFVHKHDWTMWNKTLTPRKINPNEAGDQWLVIGIYVEYTDIMPYTLEN